MVSSLPRSDGGQMPRRLLLIGFDARGVALVREALRTRDGATYTVDSVRSAADALRRLGRPHSHGTIAAGGYAALIVDFVLAQGPQSDTYDQLYVAAHPTPVLVLCSRADEAMARLAVQRGAEDYLLKEHVDGYLLPKTLCSMIERAVIADKLFEAQERAQVTLNSCLLYTSDAADE